MRSRKTDPGGPRKTTTAEPPAQTAPILNTAPAQKRAAPQHGAQFAQNAFFAQIVQFTQNAQFAAHLCMQRCRIRKLRPQVQFEFYSCCVSCALSFAHITFSTKRLILLLAYLFMFYLASCHLHPVQHCLRTTFQLNTGTTIVPSHSPSLLSSFWNSLRGYVPWRKRKHYVGLQRTYTLPNHSSHSPNVCKWFQHPSCGDGLRIFLGRT